MDQRGKPPAYILKLEMLLLILRSHQQTCQLSAEVPAGLIAATESKIGKGRVQTPCQALLSVVQGEVHSCLIRHQRTGQVLFEGSIAFDHLQQCGDLSWDVLPQHLAPAPLPFHPKDEGNPDHGSRKWVHHPPPQRAVHCEQSQINDLPRKHRQVFNLVDGQRGIEELRHMLGGSPEQLIEILNELLTKKLITAPHATDGSHWRAKPDFH